VSCGFECQADNSNGWTSDPSLYDNTTNGDVFWARISNSSIYSVNAQGQAILKGASLDGGMAESSRQYVFCTVQ
jgi:hypothetical protein